MSGNDVIDGSNRKINILFIIDEIPGAYGGTEGQLFMLVKNLDRSRFNPHFAALADTPWLHEGHLEAPVAVFPAKRLLGPGTLRQMLRFRKYCRQNEIEIIQTYFNDAYIFAALAGRLAGIKNIVAGRRNLGPGFWNKNNLLRVFRLLRYITKLYIANSEATKDSIVKYEKIEPEKVQVIYNGLDLSRFPPVTAFSRKAARNLLKIGESDLLVGMVAHLRPEKNIEFFIEAAAVIAAQYPVARFVVIGEGPLEGSLKERIREKNLSEVFRLTGSVPDIAPYLPAFDIACLTSGGESFSNAIIEYQALGLPVIATAVGGNIEAVGDSGRLFPAGDIKAFVQSLAELLESETLRKDLGNKGRALATERYSVEKMVRQHEELYSRIINS
ncbi:MAG: glycosyltransferase [bacterium]|jgi:glycosyltransferase involved in cell wall biosynthesis